ncbi:MAG: hypothetical protein ABI760_14370 [Ferruginibacter sp.]
MDRTPDQLCLLCLSNKADFKGSHFTPSCIIKNVIGKKGYENEIAIYPTKGSLSQFYGRSNLNNTDTKTQKTDNVLDHILCSSCEKKLGLLESECCTKLNELTESIKAKKIKIYKTSKGNNFVQFKKPDKNIIILFFYSIIWRQIINVPFYGGTIDIPDNFVEKLRLIITTETNYALTEIKNSNNFKNYPKLIVYTTYHFDPYSGNNYNPNPYSSNPEFFAIGLYNALLFVNDDISKNFELLTYVPASLLENDLIMNNSAETKIGVITYETWQRRMKFLLALNVYDFTSTFVNRILEQTKLTIIEAENLLKQRTATENIFTPQGLQEHFENATNEIINRFNKQ